MNTPRLGDDSRSAIITLVRSGNLLRRARTIRGLTQRQLASEVGLPQSVIARYESGRVEPSLEQLQRMLARAGLSLRTTIEPIPTRSHDLHARRSLAYHVLVADRLRVDPRLLERGRSRLAEWSTGRRPFAGSQDYLVAWQSLLSQPLDAIRQRITSTDEDARELRYNSPFNGMLGQEAWERIVETVRDEANLATR